MWSSERHLEVPDIIRPVHWSGEESGSVVCHHRLGFTDVQQEGVILDPGPSPQGLHLPSAGRLVVVGNENQHCAD